MTEPSRNDLQPADRESVSSFVRRHIGPDPISVEHMLDTLGLGSLEELVTEAIPAAIRSAAPIEVGEGAEESAALAELRELAGANRVLRSRIGMGYSDCVVPPVIARNVLEDPAWYTAYTPYQAEIAQGRLEALLNFQTMIADLTGMELANASLLDEATAAAEAMALCLAAGRRQDRSRFFVSDQCHPQTVEVVSTRAWALGVEVVVGDHRDMEPDDAFFGLLLQYPTTTGSIYDYDDVCAAAHAVGAFAVVAADPLALTLLRPPGEFGADVAVGSTQRFGVPLGFGGPHAAYLATRGRLQRRIPGRVVGVSRDSAGRVAYRLALQTREQHIRREKATSNICTAQVLPAILASMYGIYHGPEGLHRIACQVHELASSFARAVAAAGHRVPADPFFDTVEIGLVGLGADEALERSRLRGYNVRRLGEHSIAVAFDETSDEAEVVELGEALQPDRAQPGVPDPVEISSVHRRTTAYMGHPVFQRYRSETELLRYLERLAAKDLSLTSSMIPLGSCTMKLNATAEMMPLSWPELARMHPFAPPDQCAGYARLCDELSSMLTTLTGLPGVSLQPNAGSQGEFAGLLVIRRFHDANGAEDRRVCLIPQSAHGTNPASAVMAGLEVTVVGCDGEGNIDVDDLAVKAAEHRDRLAALMVTYPSTHGVFEETIGTICEVIHAHGGQVYMDGANFNAMVGLCRPAEFGVDVCHLNLHKTFCIPHGGGGPGMGPIAVGEHLEPYLPGHGVAGLGGSQSIGAVSAAPFGSPLILPISWMYIRMMGTVGLRRASQVAILNANYVAHRLEEHFPVLYRGYNGRVAHECILDLRPLKRRAGVEVEDVAKRLMDYGFHAPTVSWPVAGTVMVEPTESESRAELDRFCEAMIAIRREADEIEAGHVALERSALRNAPHPAEDLLKREWDRPYTREQAAYPAPWTREAKFWPPVSRIDNAYGDRNLICSCQVDWEDK
ncbi:MAG: aminomethyl-transferring glycine dehydrogenase [Acidobacteriota bacterium]|nr:aminomethyl-transferring glycine dehydrogenase [Acidobacteriota bacterium]